MIIKDSKVELETNTGKMLTYIYEPKTDSLNVHQEKKYPGLIFFSAIFQHTPGIERMARLLASDGYIVYLPEIYHMHLPQGTVLNADTDGTAKGNLLKKSTKLEDWEKDVEVLVRALQNHPTCSGRIGVIGHCIGGHLSLRAAFNPNVLAAACFFSTDIHSGTLGLGEKADTLARLNDVKGEVVMIYGRQDPHIPDAGRLKVYEAFQKSSVRHSWFEFQDANHSFLMDNDPKGRYDPGVSKLCFQIVFDLFHRTL